MSGWRCGLRYGLVAWLCVAGWAQAQSQPQPQPQPLEVSEPLTPPLPTREHLQQQRQALDRSLRQNEAACYQRFAVQDCLRQVRQATRQAQADVRQQAAALDAAERRERANRRLQEAVERETAHSAALAQPVLAAAPVRPKSAPSAPPQRPTRRPTQRAQQAKAVAAQAAQAQRAQQARQLRQEKNADAAQRRARVLQSQAEAAAAGRTPAASLSPPP